MRKEVKNKCKPVNLKLILWGSKQESKIVSVNDM